MEWNSWSISTLILYSFLLGWGCGDLQFKDWFGWTDIGISLVGFVILHFYRKSL